MKKLKSISIIAVAFLLLSGFLSYPAFAVSTLSDSGSAANLQAKPQPPAEPFE